MFEDVVVLVAMDAVVVLVVPFVTVVVAVNAFVGIVVVVVVSGTKWAYLRVLLS